MSFKEFWQRNLNFNTSQKVGILTLLIIICLVYFLPDLIHENQNQNFKLKIDNSIFDTNKIVYKSETSSNRRFLKNNSKFNPFVFDPNTVKPTELKRFGLPDYVINNFLKYRNSGAVFKSKEDFKKIYGLKPEWYIKIEPFIKIEILKPQTAETKYKKNETQYVSSVVEINSADSSMLIKIKGVGPYIASKILKYRNALGGFVNKSQLYEIYNVKKEMIDVFLSELNIDVALIKKINVNMALYEDLKKHPYLNWSEASAIVNYRRQHGYFKTTEDLKKIMLLKSETIEKIEPYLEF